MTMKTLSLLLLVSALLLGCAQVVPCDTDSDCMVKNPTIEPY